MHYEIKITSTEHAIEATREWLGEKKLNLLLAYLAEPRPLKQTMRCAYFYAGLAGVQGRAVIHALVRTALKPHGTWK